MLRNLHQETVSQRVSEFLKILGNERVLRGFFEKYLSAVADKECGVIIDSKGLPNEINIPVSQFGHHVGETERETRLIMVVDQKPRRRSIFVTSRETSLMCQPCKAPFLSFAKWA